MRIRIIRTPPIASVDGIRLDCFHLGVEYEVGNSIAALFLAERWAEPMPLDSPVPYAPFSDFDPFEARILNREHPPNLLRDSEPPQMDRPVAADFKRRRRPRR